MNLLLATVTARLSCFCAMLQDVRQIPQSQIPPGWRLGYCKQPCGCGGIEGGCLLDCLELGVTQQWHLHQDQGTRTRVAHVIKFFMWSLV